MPRSSKSAAQPKPSATATTTAVPSPATAPIPTFSETPQRILHEVELLMREGLRRIADVHTEMPQARHPLLEALELSEKQTMRTIEYVDSGRAAVEAIRNTRHGYIDEPLNRITEAFSIILESQQGQDLAGQRLKKALTLMSAVQERMATVLKEIPMEPPLTQDHSTEKAEKHADATPAKIFAQDDVDALLTELGI